jgi:AmiR/NasT family two-component response regulator
VRRAHFTSDRDREHPVLIKDLRSLRVLLIQPKNSEGAALRSHLIRIGCRVEEIWPPPPSPENVDIVFVMVDQVIENKLTFHWQAENPPAVLIAVIDYENPLSIDRLLRMRANAVIGLPIRPFGILTNLLVTVNNYRREQQLISNLHRLQTKLETCRTIERAKLAMMLTNSRSEQEAYDTLRQLAMKRRTTVEVVSDEILNALDWSEGDTQAQPKEPCGPELP